MRHIDAFCHFFPAALFERMSQTPGGIRDIGKRMQGVRTIYDLDARLKMMDEFDDYSEILSLGLPPIDAMAGPDKSPEFARIANDGLADLCAKYPGRFAGYVGALPMNAPDEAVKEAERILIDGNANGLQLHTNVNGACLDEPRFFPIFEVAAKSGKPILLHPARTANFPDFPAEKKSKYEIWTILGWPYETSATVARLIFSGLTTRLPQLKFLIHHLGAMIPFFDARLDTGWATLGSRTSDEDYSGVLKMLGKPLRRHGALRRTHRDSLRARILWRRSRAVCIRRAVRSAGRGKLHSRNNEGDRRARHCAGRQGEGLLPQCPGAVQALMPGTPTPYPMACLLVTFALLTVARMSAATCGRNRSRISLRSSGLPAGSVPCAALSARIRPVALWPHFIHDVVLARVLYHF